jgi:hypothetical protein
MFVLRFSVRGPYLEIPPKQYLQYAHTQRIPAPSMGRTPLARFCY